jgi:hypothetical protein
VELVPQVKEERFHENYLISGRMLSFGTVFDGFTRRF